MQTKIQKIKISVPGKYLEDKALPSVPVATMQSETSSYMVDLFYFAVECKEDKRAIKNILDNKGVSNE
ncbi:hypothetical protein CPG37_04655 [Malaciobacter canalis]|uniref:Uncharacterized protein n=1 Tax=Malaciobacter canalis TaxID=1912871 RepID=A0ABX4LVH8_9BACT|nr:hypothetical protein [Malaciobacter canalis]PHO10343.1 hypothetical protein CPG37_04655 [Malaciobacter canalis]